MIKKVFSKLGSSPSDLWREGEQHIDQQSSDVDIQVSAVTEKLGELLAREVLFVHPRLRREIRWATNDLHNYLRRFRDAAHKHKSVIPNFEAKVLHHGHLVEDITDTFLIRRELLKQRRNGLIAKSIRPLIRLSSFWSQDFLINEMKAVRLSFTTFWMKSLHELDSLVGHGDGDGDGDGDTETLKAETYRHNYLFNNASKDVGLEKLEEAIVVEMFRDNELDRGVRVIPIVGIAGSGKTTLASIVYNRRDVGENFQVRAWIRVSTGYNVRDLLIDMWRQIAGRNGAKISTEKDYNDLRKELDTLLRTNRYLVVIDGVWSPHFWDEVGHAFPDTESGSRILLTTCDSEIARQASAWNNRKGDIFQLHRLNDELMWALFLKEMRWDESQMNDLELAFLRNNVLRKCDGSPLAVIKLCRSVYTRTARYQESLRLIVEQVSSGEDRSSNFSYRLTLSYQNLPPRIRPCYLYMGLFPRAFEIPIRRLFRLWIAEGLVKPDFQSSDKTPEDLAEDYFKELVDRNMIEVTKRKSDGRPKTCRIPGILYDVFSAKAMDLGLFFVHRCSEYTSVTQPKFNVRRLAEYFDIKNYPSSSVYNQHLRSYISFNTRRRDTPAHEVGIFLDKLTAKRGFGLLRVLDLEGVYKPTLTESLGKLLQLRYVGLRWTFLDSLTDAVGDLMYLETLDVKHTNITTLPTSIWKAKNLRHLYMNEVHFDMSIQMRPSESLTNLQTLWGLSIDNRSLVVNWLSKLIGLRKLGLTCHSSRVQAIADWISKLTDLQSLKLRSIDEFGQPSHLKLANLTLHHKLSDLYLLGVLPKAVDEALQLLPNLKILTLSGSQLGEDSIRLLGKLPQLNILRLYGRSFSGRQISCLDGDFPELLVMKLWMLDELEEWKVKRGAMPHLGEVEIRGCRNLKNVEGLEHIKTLNNLTLTNMPEDLVQSVKASMSKDLSITVNEWKFPSLQVSLLFPSPKKKKK